MNDLAFHTLLIGGLVSLLANIVLYLIGYMKVRKAKTNGELTRIKRIVLLDFLIVLFEVICFSVVFGIVIFAPWLTTPALYFLAIVLVVLSLAYNIKAGYLASIVEGFK